jgi:hypothetical protein
VQQLKEEIEEAKSKINLKKKDVEEVIRLTEKMNRSLV